MIVSIDSKEHIGPEWIRARGEFPTRGAEFGVDSDWRLAPRLMRLPVRTVLGCEVPVAGSALARLLGLAWLERDRAGTGLLIPDCRSVHTFGMRFPLELVFLDRSGRVVRWEPRVGPGRILFERRAEAVLELVPGPEGGEVGPPVPSGDRWCPSGKR